MNAALTTTAEVKTPKVKKVTAKAPAAKTADMKVTAAKHTPGSKSSKPAKSKEEKMNNPMRRIILERVVLSCGGIDTNLEKAKKLLELITKKKAQINISSKRIPAFGVRPGLEVGTSVTLRGEDAKEVLRRVLVAVDNTLGKRQIAENHFSFGIKEYIEIPGLEYQRDIGIRGLNITVVFVRPGWRVKRKKIKAGVVSKKQFVSKAEIMDILKREYNVRIR